MNNLSMLRLRRPEIRWRKEEIFSKENSKYELVKDDIKIVSFLMNPKTNYYSSAIVLHRIRALKDFGDVKKGDLGGYIAFTIIDESGDCWVYDDSIAINSFVQDDCKIRESSILIHSTTNGCMNISNSVIYYCDITASGNMNVVRRIFSCVIGTLALEADICELYQIYNTWWNDIGINDIVYLDERNAIHHISQCPFNAECLLREEAANGQFHYVLAGGYKNGHLTINWKNQDEDKKSGAKYELVEDDFYTLKPLERITCSSIFMTRYEIPDNVYRIRALKDFGDVKKGDLGGYITSDTVIDQSDESWVYDNSIAWRSTITNNTKVLNSSIIMYSKITAKNIIDNSLIFSYDIADAYSTPIRKSGIFYNLVGLISVTASDQIKRQFLSETPVLQFVYGGTPIRYKTISPVNILDTRVMFGINFDTYNENKDVKLSSQEPNCVNGDDIESSSGDDDETITEINTDIEIPDEKVLKLRKIKFTDNVTAPLKLTYRNEYNRDVICHVTKIQKTNDDGAPLYHKVFTSEGVCPCCGDQPDRCICDPDDDNDYEEYALAELWLSLYEDNILFEY